MHTHSTVKGLWSIALAGVLAGACPSHAGNIDPANRFAWAENAGWVNFAPSSGGGVFIRGNGRYLTGFAWCESIGWIRLGAEGGGPYLNTTAANWGVNIGADGALAGYAWSENGGWIRFDPVYAPVSIDKATGSFDGYAWSENTGWIHFKGTDPAYNVRTTTSLVRASYLLIR